MQTNADADLRQAFFPQFNVYTENSALHCHRRIQRIGGIFGSGSWRAKQRHQPVAQILIESSAVSKNNVGHRGEVSVEQSDNSFRLSMLGDAREASNVGKEHRNCLVDSAEFKRLGVLEHLLDYIFGQEAAVVCAGHFLSCQPFMRSGVFYGDGRLGSDGTDQLQIVGFEGSKRIQSIRIDCAMNSRLANEWSTNCRTNSL